MWKGKGRIVNVFINAVRGVQNDHDAIEMVKIRDALRSKGLSDYAVIFDEPVGTLPGFEAEEARVPVSMEAEIMGKGEVVCEFGQGYGGAMVVTKVLA